MCCSGKILNQWWIPIALSLFQYFVLLHHIVLLHHVQHVSASSLNCCHHAKSQTLPQHPLEVTEPVSSIITPFSLACINHCLAFVFHSVAEPTHFLSSLSLHLSQGEYEQGVQDCDSALALCKDSCRALYRKALCLRELGRFREAYNCSTGCLLTTPNVSNIMNYPFTSEALFLE